mmetsp:Transcript_20415/g.31235  ORF Transcript_20415/g.31235 Transcript_20415/m.31235 type:complete len:133 (+) Transcript_20415:73-471(+)
MLGGRMMVSRQLDPATVECSSVHSSRERWLEGTIARGGSSSTAAAAAIGIHENNNNDNNAEDDDGNDDDHNHRRMMIMPRMRMRMRMKTRMNRGWDYTPTNRHNQASLLPAIESYIQQQYGFIVHSPVAYIL